MGFMARKVLLRQELEALLEKMAQPQAQAILMARMKRERVIRAELGQPYYVAMLAAEAMREAA